MYKSSRLLWFFVLAQTCGLAAAVGWKINHKPRFDDAFMRAAQADVRGGIKTALNMISNDCKRLPTTAEGLGALIKCPASIPSNQWHGLYIDIPGTPRDPWNHEYLYRYPGIRNTNSFDLYSLGPHGISDNGGDPSDIIGNWMFSSLDRFFDTQSVIILVMLFIPVSFVVCGSVTIFSRTAREFFARNHRARSLWLINSLLAILLSLALLNLRVRG